MTVSPSASAAGSGFADAGLASLADLEVRLGAPLDPDNPLGFAAVLAADERSEMLPAGEHLLDEYGLNAEFVPRGLGGRFAQADRLVTVLRAIFRRDGSLGLGYGAITFIAAAIGWTSGSDAQRIRMADLLLRGRRVCAGITELAHGHDLSRAEMAARKDSGRLLLTGRQELITNISRADAAVLYARTDDRPGRRSHSHLFVDMTSLPGARARQLPRFPTVGMRGCQIGGVEFLDCPVPADSVLGEFGGAMETVLRAFQVTRSVLPGMTVGITDTQLRTVLRFALGRSLYGRPAADLPHARSVLVGAFLDLLACDCLATVGARALHLLPRQTSVFAAAVEYVVPKLLREIGYELSLLLGARSYLREGPQAIFQKNSRDVRMASFGQENPAVCQPTMIPQLPRLAQRSWLRASSAPDGLFRFGEPLAALDFGCLEVTARGEDSLSAELVTGHEELAAEPVLGALVGRFAAELRQLRDDCVELPPRDLTVTAGKRSFTLADRYATVLTAAASLGVWRRNRDRADPFLRDTAWIIGVLRRLGARLGDDPGPAPGGFERHVFAELRARLDSGRTFDLAGTWLAG